MWKVSNSGRLPMLSGEPSVTACCKCCKKDIAIHGWIDDYCPFCLPEVVKNDK
jgi:hypothetical protein